MGAQARHGLVAFGRGEVELEHVVFLAEDRTGPYDAIACEPDPAGDFRRWRVDDFARFFSGRNKVVREDLHGCFSFYFWGGFACAASPQRMIKSVSIFRVIAR